MWKLVDRPGVLEAQDTGGRKDIRPVKSWVFWFVGGDVLIGALHVLQLQLLPPPPSSLVPVTSTMETFWYLLTQVVLEKGC